MTFTLTQTPIFPRRCKESRTCADFCAEFRGLILKKCEIKRGSYGDKGYPRHRLRPRVY